MRTKSICMFLSVCMIIVMLLAPSTLTQAVAYSGSGTMADPYLVQTAEQLQGIRDNLSAHYKLANTIDLSKIDFKPIGRINSPFQGSFVCELNADKTPKYIIKNLKISVAETPFISKGASKWEAALFGATNNATISGIYVLDANISNDNYGDNRGAVQYGTYKPGMDEQPTAVLIGKAESTAVSNCASSGKITARSNNCAGIVGHAENSTFENCYSMTTVKTEGKWNAGGFVAAAKNSTFSNCFATGDVDCEFYNTAGAFCGGQEIPGCSFVNCIATGELKPHDERLVIEGVKWTQGGKTPNIDSIGVVKDSSKYKAETSQKNQVNSNSSTTNPTTSNSSQASSNVTTSQTNSVESSQDSGETNVSQESNGTVVENADSVTSNPQTTNLEEVKKMIEALPDVETTTVTLDDKNAAMDAFKAYNNMSTGDKESFDAVLYKKLTDCRYQVSLLFVSDWMKRVEELPAADKLEIKNIEEINQLWDEYEFLSDELIQEMDKEIIDKIEAAHQYAMDNADKVQDSVVEVDNGLTAIELIIVIFCLSVFVIIMVAVIWAEIALVKRIRSEKNTDDEEE